MTLADPHLTTPAPYTPPVLEQDTDQHALRVLIDEVATTRGLTIQMSTRALAYHAAPDDALREVIRTEFDGMLAQFHHNIELTFGSARMDALDPDHVAILRKAAARDPQRALKMRSVAAAAEAMAGLMRDGGTISFEHARRFFAENWPVARDQMTQVIWDVWADLDMAREAHLSAATRAADALVSRLDRLEHIGKHVRLVSLNASVEAARAGDVGKGLMVIAQEFKALAEEIQVLAKDARTDMDAIS